VRRALLVALLTALAVPAPASAADLGLAETAGTRSPDRAYVLDLPAPRPITAADVTVRENGELVPGVTVTTPDPASAQHFGVVLAIDASDSMRGAPLTAAVTAAREFVRNRNAAQPVAVVAFAGTVEVLLPFTTDHAAIERALAGISNLGRGSRLLDATQRGVELIAGADLSSGAVVVLSDGADRKSVGTVEDVAAAAKDANARVYAIGLLSRGREFGVPNLLAAATHGEFSSVESATDLARVYGRLGSSLGHQYVVRYRSAAARDRRVRVEVRVAGIDGAATAAYRTPALRRPAGAPFQHAPAERLWLSPATASVLCVIFAALVFTAVWLLMRPRQNGVRERMASWVGAEESTGSAGGTLTGIVLAGAERSLDGREWWQRFMEALDIGRVGIPAVRLLAWVAIGTLAAMVLFALVGGSPAFALLAAVVPFGTWLAIRRRVVKQRRLFMDQMPDNLQVVASAMRAGHSFAGALAVVVEDASEPSRRELQRAIADERLGMPLDVALGTAVRRMQNKDLEQVALVAALQRETGGNTAEVLDRVTETVRERLALRRMVSSLTAQGRMSRWVLTGIPVFLLVFMTAINSTYMSPLYTTGIGKALLVICALSITAGSLVIKKIVDIEV
jgi:tight adherence protein B